MKFSISKEANVNYLAKIVKLDDSNFSPHPNADKLKLVHICGNTISTGIESEPGYYVYFPTECIINSNFLSVNNLYKNQDLNFDRQQKGFFEKDGRVRCIKLRGIASEGFIMPYMNLYQFVTKRKVKDSDILAIYEEANSMVDKSFDTVNDIKFVWKYIIKTNFIGPSNSGFKQSNISKLLIDNQFRFHIETQKLQNNINVIHPNDIIHCSIKVHGTNFCACNLLVNKKLNIFEKLLKKLKVQVKDTEYQTFCSSRRIIKDSVDYNKLKSISTCDIYTMALDVLKPYISKGQSLYGEIAGYFPNGKMIQKGYDYGCAYSPGTYNYAEMSPKQMYDVGLFKLYIFRITTTNVDGKVYEWSAKQVKDWCLKNNLAPVYELYYGYAKDLFNIKVDDKWNEIFVEKLREKYLEKDSILCNDNVPEEGIVIRREVSSIDVYKFKSNRFLQRETSELDKGVINIEDVQG